MENSVADLRSPGTNPAFAKSDRNLVGVVSLLSGAPEAEVALRYDEMVAKHRGARIGNAYSPLRKILGLYRIRLSHSRIFHSWHDVPKTGLIPTRWAGFGAGANWGWSVFLCQDVRVSIVRPEAGALAKVGTPGRIGHPPWYVEVFGSKATLDQYERSLREQAWPLIDSTA